MATSGRNPDIGIRSPFSELITTMRHPLLSVSSTDVLSILRDEVSTTSSGTVTDTTSEYLVSAPSSGDDAELRTARRGRYEPGFASEIGVGIRLNDRATGGVVMWGGYDDQDGVRFRLDDDGLAAQVLRNGTVTHDIDHTSFNVDPLDGTGPSGIDVADAGGLEAFLQDGHVFQIRWTWYGYGMIEWAVIDQSVADSEQRVWPLHRLKIDAATSVENPHIPVTVFASDDASVYVGGRQYSTLGPINVTERNVGEFRLAQSVPRAATPAWIPLIGIRRRSGASWSQGIRIVADSFQVSTNQKLVAQVFIGGSLDNGSWVEVQNSDGTSAVEVNRTATTMTFASGTFPDQTIGLEPVLIPGSSGPQKRSTAIAANKRFALPGSEELILAVKGATSGTDATVDSTLVWDEIR